MIARRDVVVACAIGGVPIVIGRAVSSSWHQPLTAALLTALLLPALFAGHRARALSILAVTIVAHSLVAIALSARDPRAAEILPGASSYTESAMSWVARGHPPDGPVCAWMAIHAALIAAVALGSATSLGFVPLWAGIQQIDLMNHWVGRVVATGASPSAVAVAWHPWSIARGIGCALLLCEVVIVVLRRWERRDLEARTTLRVLACACALFAVDAALKLALTPPVREILAAAVRAS